MAVGGLRGYMQRAGEMSVATTRLLSDHGARLAVGAVEQGAKATSSVVEHTVNAAVVATPVVVTAQQAAQHAAARGTDHALATVRSTASATAAGGVTAGLATAVGAAVTTTTAALPVVEAVSGAVRSTVSDAVSEAISTGAGLTVGAAVAAKHSLDDTLPALWNEVGGLVVQAEGLVGHVDGSLNRVEEAMLLLIAPLPTPAVAASASLIPGA